MAADLNSSKDLSDGLLAKSPEGQSLNFERLDKASSNTLKVRNCLNNINCENLILLVSSFHARLARLTTTNYNYSAPIDTMKSCIHKGIV
jgi:hypothetical protein